MVDAQAVEDSRLDVMDVDRILDFYLAAFKEDNWSEDSVMSTKSSCIIGFIKDDLLVFVEANTGNLGAIVKIVTGMQD